MNLFRYIFFFSIVALGLVSCTDEDLGWDPPSNNVPTGNYLYQSSTMYYERNGKADPETPVPGAGYLKLTLYLNSADVNVTPKLGWTYQIHLSNLTEHTLDDGSVITSFAINPQQVELDYYYYDVMGTNNKDIRNSDGSLIGYYDGYFKSDSLVYEFRSNDGQDAWTIANIKARVRN